MSNMVSTEKWVQCQRGTALSKIVDGEDCFQILNVAVNTLSKHLRTAKKGWSCSLDFGRGTVNLSQ